MGSKEGERGPARTHRHGYTQIRLSGYGPDGCLSGDGPSDHQHRTAQASGRPPKTALLQLGLPATDCHFPPCLCRYIPAEGETVVGFIVERHAEVGRVTPLAKLGSRSPPLLPGTSPSCLRHPPPLSPLNPLLLAHRTLLLTSTGRSRRCCPCCRLRAPPSATDPTSRRGMWCMRAWRRPAGTWSPC